MRLPLLAPAELNQEQKALYSSIRQITDSSFKNFSFETADGSLIGPFNAMLHFPQFGTAAWALNKSMYDHSTLAKAVVQVCVLVTAANMKARYQMFGHEHLAADAGMPREKIATLSAGEKPSSLSHEEAVAFDLAKALNAGGSLPEAQYQVGREVFGDAGLAEIIYLIGTFHLIAVILNGYDVGVPG